MINEHELNEILAPILNSSEFHESKRHQDLLTYLAHESLKSDPLKESTVAHDFFGKDASFDPSKETLVRSYISTLRKKLEHYYLTTEDSFKYKLEIPKGHYLVKFIKEKQTNRKKWISLSSYIYISVIVVIAAVLIVHFLSDLTKSYNKETIYQSPNPVWTELISKSDRTTIFVFGDYVFLSEKKQLLDREVFLRDPNINSEDDFQNFLKEHPESLNKYKLLNFTYLRQSAYLGLADILPLLWRSNNPIDLQSASQLKWKDFENHNIIFIGPFKTLHILSTLLANTNLKYSNNPQKLTIVNDVGKPVSTLNLTGMRGGTYQKDYGIVLKLRGSENNTILLLTGFGEAGVMNAVRASIDPQLLNKIKNYTKTEIPDTSFYFELITEIEGVDQTVFRSEIKYFKLLFNTRKIIR